ncbi:MAG: Uncharacterised protein [Methanobacteriota archaeon]|nr:MAG: Uncharacterised protein [Euryarchaeota archaeon]
MGEEIDEVVESIGMFELVRRMLSPKTLPHIILVAIVSAILMSITKSNQGLAAIMFLSFSISYGIIALMAKNSTIQKLTKLSGKNTDENTLLRIAKSFRICVVPVLIAGVLTGILWSLFNENNQWIVILLASLFIIWSIAQARSFRTGMVEWLSNGLGDAQLHTYREKLSTASLIIIVQLFAFIIIWVGQMVTSSESMTIGDAILGGIGFLVISVLIQLFSLWLTREERERAGNEKGLSGFSFKWMIISQLFITWHCFSLYRRKFLDPSMVSTIIEESILMAFTVLFAVWALTNQTVKDKKRLIDENSALPLGISFGFAYAGSVAMLTGTFEHVNNVLASGHLIAVITTLFIVKSTLVSKRKSSDTMKIAKSIDISSKDDDVEEEENSEEENGDSDDEKSEDDDVDWDNPESIGDEAEWEEEKEDDSKE